MKGLNNILAKIVSGGFSKLSHKEKTILFREMASTGDRGKMLRGLYADVQGPLMEPKIAHKSKMRRIFKEEVTNDSEKRFPVTSKFDGGHISWFFDADESKGFGMGPYRQCSKNLLTAIPTYPIMAGVNWDYKDIESGGYKILSYHENTMIDEVVRQEDINGWMLIKSAFAYGDIEHISGDERSFSINVLNKLIESFEGKKDGSSLITDLYMSRRRYNEIKNELNRYPLSDVEEKLALFRISFHPVDNSNLVTDNRLWAFGEGFGVMNTVEEWHTTDDPVAVMRWKQGIIGSQEVGIAITDLNMATVYGF